MTDYDEGQEAAHESAHSEAQNEDDGYEDVEEELPVQLDDIGLDLVAQISLDESEVAYLAQAEVPDTLEGVDWSTPDYDDGTAVA